MDEFDEYLISPFLMTYDFFNPTWGLSVSIYNLEWFVYYAGIISLTVIILNRLLLNVYRSYRKFFLKSFLILFVLAVTVTSVLSNVVLSIISPIFDDVDLANLFSPFSIYYYLFWTWPLIISLTLSVIANKLNR